MPVRQHSDMKNIACGILHAPRVVIVDQRDLIDRAGTSWRSFNLPGPTLQFLEADVDEVSEPLVLLVPALGHDEHQTLGWQDVEKIALQGAHDDVARFASPAHQPRP